MVGKQGRVTGRIAPGLLGEVMIAIRGGSEAFLAYASLGTESYEIGALVTVVDYFPPRTVYVVPALV
jgi:hypothetical protein